MGDVTSVVLDVTDEESVTAAAAKVRERYGRLDALINNAGISGRPGVDFAGQDPATGNVDDVRFIFETNVFGVIRVTTAFLPLLRRSEAARIVNVSAAQVPSRRPPTSPTRSRSRSATCRRRPHSPR